MNKNLASNILIFVLFFAIRIICKFIIDKDLDDIIIHNTSLDNIEREILENSISLSFSFLIINIIHKYVLGNFEMIRSISLEIFSILLGAIIIIILYRSYKKYTNKEIKIVRKDRDINKDNIIDP